MCATDASGDACYCADPSNAQTNRCFCYDNPSDLNCLTLDCPIGDSARALTTDALEAADRGAWERSRELTLCALRVDAADDRANLLRSQLDLGGEYFAAIGMVGSQPYEVQPGDTLGSIAANCLGRGELFVALALANELDAPKNLTPGDRLVIPGERACAPSVDYLAEALAAEQRGDLQQAWRFIQRAGRGAQEARLRIGSAYASQVTEQALEAVERDCPGARAQWRQALAIDASNEEAAFFLREVTCE
ncbi:MAG: LysM peptidoglycan-binding domain-containing protein [Pseudomonadota bacterium]